MGNYLKTSLNMNDNHNCCCFCFSVSTGVRIIGVLLWCSFISQSFFLFRNGLSLHWYVIPSMLITLYLGILYAWVVINRGTKNDFAARTQFAKNYLWVGLLANAALQFTTYIIRLIILKRD